jgi:hypothetical protein
VDRFIQLEVFPHVIPNVRVGTLETVGDGLSEILVGQCLSNLVWEQLGKLGLGNVPDEDAVAAE